MVMITPTIRTSSVEEWVSVGADPKIHDVPMPNTIALDDYVMVFFRTNDRAVPGEAKLSGFTRLFSESLTDNSRYQAIFAKKITTPAQVPGSSVPLTRYGYSGRRNIAVVVVLSGVNLGNPYDGISQNLGSWNGSRTIGTREPMNSTVSALDFFVGNAEFTATNSHIPLTTPDGYTLLKGAVSPSDGDMSASRTYSYVGYKTSISEIASDASISWDHPISAALMAISINGLDDGTGGNPDGISYPKIIGDPELALKDGSYNSFSVRQPKGIRHGDILVLAYRTNGATSPDDFASPGFTRIGLEFKPASTYMRVSGFQARVVDDVRDEPLTYEFEKTKEDTRLVAALFIVRGAKLPEYLSGASTKLSGSDEEMIIDSFGITEAYSLIVAMFANEETAGYSTYPESTPASYYTNFVGNHMGDNDQITQTRTSMWVGSKEFKDPGLSGDISLTWEDFHGRQGEAVALAGSPSPTDSPYVDTVLPNGRRGTISYMLDGTRKAPARVYGYKKSYPTVTEAFQTHGLTWSHRGGSTTWPEMSEYAYDRSVARGYTVLEFSTVRSSDGWWFGLHDSNFDRTSETTESLPPKFYTQVEIHENFLNKLNDNGVPTQYYGLVDFLNKYSNANVLVIDPKGTDYEYFSEFLDILDAHGGPERIVIKFYGAYSKAVKIATDSANRGYTTWGYYFQSDYDNGLVDTYQSHWSALGMAWNATASAWANVTSYGKPVVGHICANQEQYDIAMNKGADMVQCSGVAVIDAVPAVKP